jgi:hypothetical protein
MNGSISQTPLNLNPAQSGGTPAAKSARNTPAAATQLRSGHRDEMSLDVAR